MILPSAFLLDLNVVLLVGLGVYLYLVPVAADNMCPRRDLRLEKGSTTQPRHSVSVEEEGVLLAWKEHDCGEIKVQDRFSGACPSPFGVQGGHASAKLGNVKRDVLCHFGAQYSALRHHRLIAAKKKDWRRQTHVKRHVGVRTYLP